MKLTRRQLRKLIFEQIRDSVDIDIDTKLEAIPAPPEPEIDMTDDELLGMEVEREANIPPDPYGIADEGFYDEEDYTDDPFNPDSPYSLDMPEDNLSEGWFGFGKTQKEKDDEKISMLRKKHGHRLAALKKGIDIDDERDPIADIEMSIDDMAGDLGYARSDDLEDLEIWPEYAPVSTEEKIKQLQRKLQIRKMKRNQMFK